MGGDVSSGDIKVEKIDLSDGEDCGESSLDAALGQLAKYEGAYGGAAATSAHGEREGEGAEGEGEDAAAEGESARRRREEGDSAAWKGA